MALLIRSKVRHRFFDFLLERGEQRVESVSARTRKVLDVLARRKLLTIEEEPAAQAPERSTVATKSEAATEAPPPVLPEPVVPKVAAEARAPIETTESDDEPEPLTLDTPEEDFDDEYVERSSSGEVFSTEDAEATEKPRRARKSKPKS